MKAVYTYFLHEVRKIIYDTQSLIAAEFFTTLYENLWFKDISRIIQDLAVLEKLGIEAPWKTYSSLQKKIVNELRQSSGLNITESDAFLIATLNVNETSSEQKSNLFNFQRGNKYRFCLTPFFEYMEVFQIRDLLQA